MLEDITLELMEINERDGKTAAKLSDISDVVSLTLESTFDITSHLEKIFKSITSDEIKVTIPELEATMLKSLNKDRMDDSFQEENRREMIAILSDIAKSIKGGIGNNPNNPKKPNNDNNDPAFSLIGFGLNITSLAAAAVGSVTGLYSHIFKSFGALSSTVIELTKTGLDKLRKLFSFNFKLPNIKGLNVFTKWISDVSKLIGAITSSISSASIGKLAGLGESLKSFFGSGPFKFFFRFGEVILKPLFTIWNVFKNVRDDTENAETLKDRVIGTITGVIKGIVETFITSFLDLGKSMVSWIAGALGFGEVEAMLDSFSFTNKFAELVDSVTDWFRSIELPEFDYSISGIMDDIIEWFGNIADKFSLDNISDTIKGFFGFKERIDVDRRGRKVVPDSNELQRIEKTESSTKEVINNSSTKILSYNNSERRMLARETISLNNMVRESKIASDASNKNGGGTVIAPSTINSSSSNTSVTNISQLGHESDLALGV